MAMQTYVPAGAAIGIGMGAAGIGIGIGAPGMGIGMGAAPLAGGT